MNSRKCFTVLLIIACSIFFAFPALAFYCGNKLVSEGDSAAEVLLKCGEPTRKESHLEKIIEGVDTAAEHRTTITVGEWFYNFGPQKWLYHLTFKNSKLVQIDTLGYGYRETEAGNACDKGRRIATGDTITEVLQKCGEPVHKDVREDEIRRRIDRDTERRVKIIIEEWTYNFGPMAWIYVVRFENGKVVDINTRGYGY